MPSKIKGHGDNFTIDTLDIDELVLQWKIMKAMGYKSLFDPEFRREMRNPVRRFLYYRIVVAEERQQKTFFTTSLDAMADSLNFHSDPELYNKVKREQEKIKIESGDKETIANVERRTNKDLNKYSKMDSKELKESLELINR